MMMIVNNTGVLRNSTQADLAPGSPAGFATGLTLFFLLLVSIVALVIYKYSSKVRTVAHVGQRKIHKKEDDCADTGRDDSQHYTSLMTGQSTTQTPIYENLTSLKAGPNRHRVPAEPGEDLYLQCDLMSGGIYTNDFEHNSIPQESREEDIYIIPDA